MEVKWVILQQVISTQVFSPFSLISNAHKCKLSLGNPPIHISEEGNTGIILDLIIHTVCIVHRKPEEPLSSQQRKTSVQGIYTKDYKTQLYPLLNNTIMHTYNNKAKQHMFIIVNYFYDLPSKHL